MNLIILDEILETMESCQSLTADALKRKFETSFANKAKRKCVLGIDIYKYSSKKELPKNLLPILYQHIYSHAIVQTVANNHYLFFNSTPGEKAFDKKHEEFKKNSIDTGDGGFQVFDTPLHALAFLTNFAMLIHQYNSLPSYANLREVIGEIKVRYALTYDTVYRYVTHSIENGVSISLSLNEEVISYSHNHDNIYGDAIINNARILSKDKLARLLIDDNTYQWLMRNIHGPDNIPYLTREKLSKVSSLGINTEILNERSRVSAFDHDTKEECNDGKNSFKFVQVSHIGPIHSKTQEIEIYNMYMKICSSLKNEPKAICRDIYHDIGNLNSEGLQ